MEASSSCSSPLSLHSFIHFSPSSISPSKHRSVSAKFGTSRDCHGRRRVVSINPAASSCGSNSSSYFGFSIQPKSSSANAIFKSYTNRRPSFPIVSAVFERFTERAIKAVMFSQKEARALGNDMVSTQHLLLGLIAENRDPDGFLGSGINIDMARDAVRSIWHEEAVDDRNKQSPVLAETPSSSSSSASATDVPFSVSTKRVFEAAVEYSKTMRYNFIAPEHIAIGLFTVDDGNAARVMKKLGVNTNHLAAAAISRLQGELLKDGRELPSSQKKRDEKLSSGKIIIDRSLENRDKSSLSEFCVDLTARASDGMIDPVIGRDFEIQRIIQILCRRTKNNPILLGEAGVGKTAIAEGLAISIAQGDVPVFLQGKRVMSLDIGLLIAGAKERGELETRVTTLIKDIKKSGKVILFIDEVHTLVGSGTVGRGNKGSGLDISNLLKPSLGRGELQCVASTTLDEYRSHFEKDPALARRFQPVFINEPSQEDAVRILLGVRTKYESHHKCRYTLEAINAAVQLSARYIPDRHLPDKAIDLIDEAGSKVRMDAYKRKKEQQIDILSKSPTDYWQEINSVKTLHEMALSRKLDENDGATEFPDTYLPYKPLHEGPLVVGPAEIAAVASLWSGIPVEQLTVDEMKMLVGLDEQLKKRVIGQGEAVDAICRAVRRSRVGLKDPDRPIAAMLFCGPTGVGKTELTKALAASYFGSEAAMLRLDMSEYMERHTVSKLIGSPPGYVGYGEGGILTEAIRRQPFTVVLLDEIEKAHPDIFNILLQLFEDGHLTDSQGRRVSFKNALVVMTSNVGSAAIAKGRHKSIGFMLENDESTSYNGMKALLIEELKNYFRPELLNRIDEIVVFRPLEQNQMMDILNLMLEEVKGRVASIGISLEISEAVIKLICEQGFERSYGARPLRRAVTLIIEDVLSEAILSGKYKPGDTAIINLDQAGNPIVMDQTDENMYLTDTTSTSIL